MDGGTPLRCKACHTLPAVRRRFLAGCSKERGTDPAAAPMRLSQPPQPPHEQVVGAVGWNKERLPVPVDVPPAMRDLIEACFGEPQGRPSFRCVVCGRV